jgi:hypothetical protein
MKTAKVTAKREEAVVFGVPKELVGAAIAGLSAGLAWGVPKLAELEADVFWGWGRKDVAARAKADIMVMRATLNALRKCARKNAR